MSPKITLRLFLRHGQNLLVYPIAYLPRYGEAVLTPAKYGMEYLAPLIRTPDSVDLSCYVIPQTEETLARDPQVFRDRVSDEKVYITAAAANARATVIMFHGNATHHWDDIPTAKEFFEMKCNVVMISYRGYGASRGGYANESGIRIDAQAVLEAVLKDPHLSRPPIILYGLSLGGGVAIDLASRNPSTISAIIVTNTFTSIPDIVRTWPIIGVFSFLCHQKWNSAGRMRHIPVTTPILMLSGRLDRVVPPKLMDRLWGTASKRGSSRWFWQGWRTKDTDETVPRPAYDVFKPFEYRSHNDTTFSSGYWETIQEFVAGVGERERCVRLPSNDTPCELSTARRWLSNMGLLEIEQLSTDAL
ncbi:Protein bem46 [Hypsizygus marmoreus]|uniref:Protein bem46 n=1 Tax=Hypsizygus marmoreus TaxID=39966 RepID=A0A369K781_HYPMA|nr:Protein bem46 [Hypsizygus marmoreus]